MSAAKSRSKPVSSLEQQIGYWFRLVSNSISAEFARKLESFDVSVSEWVAMRKLFDQPRAISISALAEQMGMTKAPVSRLVERLVQKELVNRQASRNDGRAQQIWLSTDGQKLVPKLAAIADENDEAFFGHLSANSRLTMIALMQELAKQYRLTQVHGLSCGNRDDHRMHERKMMLPRNHCGAARMQRALCCRKHYIPEVVGKLMEVGIESITRICIAEKTYYAANGDSHMEYETVSIRKYSTRARSPVADPNCVKQALREIQHKEIDYQHFSRHPICGRRNYWVYLAGKRAVYVARNGDE